MRRTTVRNRLVETAIELYLDEVAAFEKFAPIRAVQISNWAGVEYQCEIESTVVLYQLKRLSDLGRLRRVISHSPYFEYHFYLPLEVGNSEAETT